ncbi:hypothetical protein [Alcanivorax sp. 1008]|jgi:hypothetical protein|nr:hypothetical protein [Alcanivorax sp. 1008]MCC1495530.1 hypothetical protein [Alcanivorax sp. 1008]MEE4252034.1 hypothetical protein [Alcanivoracaceae bacterium]
MYTDPIVLAGIAAVVGTALVAVGFFVFIMVDNADHPSDEDDEAGENKS